jgi:hypothetical protein
MQLIPTQVECLADHKADEQPRCSIYGESRLEVEEVVECWHQVGRLPDWPRAVFFKVRAGDGRLYLLKHDLEVDQWFLAGRW